MPRVSKLDPRTVSLLRTGIIVNSYAQAVEELVCNSLDAGSTQIDLEIKRYDIKVCDNGHGISSTNLKLIGERYATSKLWSVDDLAVVQTHGFKGEALTSLVSVSLVEIVTRTADEGGSLTKIVKGDKILYLGPSKGTAGRDQVGTTIHVRDLFYNQPVRRRRFDLKQEVNRVKNTIAKYALIYPDVAFTLSDLSSGRRRLVRLDTQRTVVETMKDLFHWTPRAMVNVQGTHDGVATMTGLITLPGEGRSATDMQFISVNKRPIARGSIHRLIEQLYRRSFVATSVTARTQRRRTVEDPRRPVSDAPRVDSPVFIIDFQVPLGKYDIHFLPNKSQCQFEDELVILALVQSTVTDILVNANPLNVFLRQSSPDVLAHVGQDDPASPSQPPSSASPAHSTLSFGSVTLDASDSSSVSPVKHGRTPTRGKRSNPPQASKELLEAFRHHEPAPAPLAKKSRVSENEPDQPASTPISKPFNQPPPLMPPQSLDPSRPARLYDVQRNSTKAVRDSESLVQSNVLSDVSGTVSSAQVYPPHGCQPLQVPGHDQAKNGDCDCRHSSSVARPASEKHPCGDTSAPSVNTLFTAWKQAEKERSNAIRNLRMERQTNAIMDVSPHSGFSGAPLVAHQVTKEIAGELSVITQVNSKFFLCIARGILYCVDQHAADERVTLEALQNEHLTCDQHGVFTHPGPALKSYRVPTPLVFHASARERELLMLHGAQVKKWLFDVSPVTQETVGDTAPVSLRAVPSVLDTCLTLSDLVEYLVDLDTFNGRPPHPPQAIMRLLASKACHRAVRFGDSIPLEQCQAIMSKLSSTRFPFQCAHGRPSLFPLVDQEGLKVQLSAKAPAQRPPLYYTLEL